MMSVMTATESAPDGKHQRRAVERDAANRHQRATDSLAPFGDARQTLRRPGHRFQRGGVDGAERDIVGLGFQSDLQLLEAMRADADLDVGGPDGAEIGGSEILLAEMHEIRAERRWPRANNR